MKSSRPKTSFSYEVIYGCTAKYLSPSGRKRLATFLSALLLVVYHLLVLTTIVIPANLITNASTFSEADVETSVRLTGVGHRSVYLGQTLKLKRKLPVVVKLLPLEVILRFIRPGDRLPTSVGRVEVPSITVDARHSYPTLEVSPICFTYFDAFAEFLYDFVFLDEPLIAGVMGDAEALIFSSLRRVPVSVSVESNLAVRGGYLAGLVPDSLSPYATRERERRALVIPRRRGKTPE